MTIDFTKIKLEGDDKAALDTLLKNKTFTEYVTEAVTNRENAARETADAKVTELNGKLDEFRDTNLELKKKIEAFNGVDVEEYTRLQKLGGDATKAAEQLKAMELDHKGVVDGLNEKISTLTGETETLNSKLADQGFQFEVRNAVAAYNKDNPNLAVQAGAEQILVEKALAARKIVGDKTVMLTGDGKEFTTDSGIGTLAEWVGSEGRTQFPFLFQQPSGSGATGDGGAGGGNTMKRSEFNAIKDPAKKHQVATNKEVTIVDD